MIIVIITRFQYGISFSSILSNRPNAKTPINKRYGKEHTSRVGREHWNQYDSIGELVGCQQSDNGPTKPVLNEYSNNFLFDIRLTRRGQRVYLISFDR